jgi:hypothetical protein
VQRLVLGNCFGELYIGFGLGFFWGTQVYIGFGLGFFGCLGFRM